MMQNRREVGAIIACLGWLFCYHVVIYSIAITGANEKIQLAVNMRNATRWVLKHKEKGDAPTVTLAIQTLRNTILVATFVAGFAFTYAFDFTNSYNDHDVFQLKARAVILSTCLFCSFLSWACVIRYANHLGFLVGTLSYMQTNEQQTHLVEKSDVLAVKKEETDLGQDKEPEDQNTQYVQDCVRNTKLVMIFFSLGFRFMFISLPFSFLSMGYIALLCATSGIFLFLLCYDFNFFNM